MPKQKFDYLIIGQGLAGSILAHHLIARDYTVCVLDNHHHRSSSSVAAGIINPVTGHRLNITAGFESFYPVAERYYQQLEKTLGRPLWSPLKQLRLIKNKGQFDYFQQRLKQAEYQSILGPKAEQVAPFKDSEYGSCEVKQTAVVDCAELLSSTASWLASQQCLIDDLVDYQEIRQAPDGFSYKGLQAAKLIFCEGHQAIHNPWLAQLPFKLSKGVVLEVATDTKVEKLLNWGNWLVPSGKSNKLGSSYEWHELSFEPNYETESKLVDRLQIHTHIKAQVTEHKIGIRPTTEQRLPFVGALRNLPDAFCFNGFGSKGCLVIPYYAELLCDHLISGRTIPGELNRCL